MKRILITGATGNVGIAILEALQGISVNVEVLAGVRNLERDSQLLRHFGVKPIEFDFEASESFVDIFKTVDTLFLLRPPQLADVQKYFNPLVDSAVENGVKYIVFLSVQGAEDNSVIPHHKIERLIIDSGISYTFLRPAYFMQNFTTTLRKELVENNRIFLPAGDAKFTLIDVQDVGKVAAKILLNPEKHVNIGYDLTNNETLTFGEMAKKLSGGLNRKIEFVSPNLLRFFIQKRKEDVAPMFIFVMIMLHYFPRFQKSPNTSNAVQEITGNPPVSFDEFVRNNVKKLSGRKN